MFGGIDLNATNPDTVLVADDDLVFRTLLQSSLPRWGYKATLVEDGFAAWREIQGEHGPRLLLLDWMMPGIDGVEICRRVRAQQHELYTYILVLTSKHDKRDAIFALDAGADDYITKPFDAHELRARMQVGRRILQLQDEVLRSREQLRSQAMLDSLTGLCSRRSIFQSLSDEAARSKRTGVPLGLLMLDLDNFKTINDTHGHLAGDCVLAQVADRMVSVVRPYDHTGRYGGDEFLIVLPDCPADLLATVAERIRARIADQPVITVGARIEVTVSIGGAIATPDSLLQPENAIRIADAALYRAKRAGRNRCLCDTNAAAESLLGFAAAPVILPEPTWPI